MIVVSISATEISFPYSICETSIFLAILYINNFPVSPGKVKTAIV